MLAHFNEYKIELFDTDTPLPGIPTITEEMKRFYLIFVYIHLYPKCRHMTAVLRIAGEPRGANKHWYDTYCRPIAWKLGEIMREVHPEDRFDHMNHCPFFSSRITEIKDSLPIRVATSSNSMINIILHAPKYGCNVIKLTIGCTFTAIPTSYSINIGIQHDGTISVVEEGESWDYRESWEWTMGDGPYEVLPRCLVKHRPQPIPGSRPMRYAPLTQDELADNGLHEFYRGRIEHVNAEFDAHGLFEGRKYRGPLQDIIAYIHITMHAMAALIRDFEPSRQRTGFGPFPHYRPVV